MSRSATFMAFSGERGRYYRTPEVHVKGEGLEPSPRKCLHFTARGPPAPTGAVEAGSVRDAGQRRAAHGQERRQVEVVEADAGAEEDVAAVAEVAELDRHSVRVVDRVDGERARRIQDLVPPGQDVEESEHLECGRHLEPRQLVEGGVERV